MLAGGTGTRLYPVTRGINKQLIPVYDKPMIYYPLSTLMLAGIRDILIISTPRDLPLLRDSLSFAKSLGLNLSFAEQPEPKGIAQAFLIGEEFIGSDPCCLILGDNIFFGEGLGNLMRRTNKRTNGATIFSSSLENPQRYGVVELSKDGKALSIEEKPVSPKSHLAITGIYFYDNRVVDLAKSISPSERGELEITSINQAYLEMAALKVETFGHGYAWFDAGTHNSLLDASNYIATIERRQGLKIACLEEIAWRQGWINGQELKDIATLLQQTNYGQYLLRLLDG